MRLGQLARKLALRPDQIVEFLAKKNIQIVEGSNTRLEDNQVALVIEKFAPRGFDITVQELTSQGVVQPTETPEIPAEPQVEEIEVFSRVEDTVLEFPTSEEKSEVIKAPKVELSGLKVLGKIDLPEPKKKEQPKAEPQFEGEKPKSQERTRSLQSRSPKSNSRPAKNPIALQREKEELEAQRKREASKALEREKRAQHYFNKVKVVTAVKPAKRDQIQEEMDEPAPKPKTLLGRFFRWFTT
jgi:type IV secretory pathway VirB10-like protein